MKKAYVIHGMGERLAMIRTAFNKTYEEMGFIVNSSGWRGYEKEQTTPKASVISELCLLGINANWLLIGKGPLLRDDISFEENSAANKIISTINEHHDRDRLLIAALEGKIPAPATSPNPMGKGKQYSYKLIGGLRDPVIRQMVMDLRHQGVSFCGIDRSIREAYPNNPEKCPSRTAIHKFYQAARKGRLLEYGIGRTI